MNCNQTLHISMAEIDWLRPSTAETVLLATLYSNPETLPKLDDPHIQLPSWQWGDDHLRALRVVSSPPTTFPIASWLERVDKTRLAVLEHTVKQFYGPESYDNRFSFSRRRAEQTEGQWDEPIDTKQDVLRQHRIFTLTILSSIIEMLLLPSHPKFLLLDTHYSLQLWVAPIVCQGLADYLLLNISYSEILVLKYPMASIHYSWKAVTCGASSFTLGNRACYVSQRRKKYRSLVVW
jgi:hypothetical protein